ncbi:MAG TPA: FAD-dependent oxidoreductase [Acetobacteraceae bacterium]|nr:FAD-dependent oxidoreductase [Acetobacteraceae bacterium]
MVHDFETVVVGAGVVGLAVARALALAGHEVLVVERHRAAGTETSSRNSEVIHAGLYYQPGSLRARLCVAGREALYGYCAARGVTARRLGKLVVATDAAEAEALRAVAARAAANGVAAARLIEGGEARAMEPALFCTEALLSPDTGIVDSHALMQALAADAEAGGAVFAYRTELADILCEDGGFRARTVDGAAVRCARMVNAAGLGAVALARRTSGLAAGHVPPAYFAKGSYFALAGRSPFRRLIYPVPIPGGAGIHLTLDLAGRARFGPDVEAVAHPEYDVDPARAAAFYGAIRRYWPGLPDGTLMPAYAGVRPKIVPPLASQDFIIQDEADHGIAGLVNLFGVESPGLTACLAIAADVARRLA